MILSAVAATIIMKLIYFVLIWTACSIVFVVGWCFVLRDKRGQRKPNNRKEPYEKGSSINGSCITGAVSIM